MLGVLEVMLLGSVHGHPAGVYSAERDRCGAAYNVALSTGSMCALITACSCVLVWRHALELLGAIVF